MADDNAKITEKLDKIKDLEEFARIYKLSLPVPLHAKYYLETLFKSPQYASAVKAMDEYIKFEEYLKNNTATYESARDYKAKKSDQLSKYIKETEAYKRIDAIIIDKKENLEGKDKRKQFNNMLLISIDLRKANFTTMKIFDDENALTDSWESLLDKNEVHPAFYSSKIFRQVVFGHTNPARNMKLQKRITIQILEAIKKNIEIDEKDIVFISHDELVFNCQLGNTINFNLVNKLIALLQNGIEIELGEKKKLFVLDKQTHYTLYKNVPTGQKQDRGLKIIYKPTIEGDIVTTVTEDTKQLFGIPSNQYFVNFKQHVLKEPLDNKDFLFVVDGHLAQWTLNNHKLQPVSEPVDSDKSN
jgi:hypothetical protein